MYLTEASLWKTVRKQHAFKMKSYAGMFTSLVVIQVIAVLFSLNGISGQSMSNESYSIQLSHYSGDMVIFLSLLWAFISGVIITTRAYRNDDFTFVTNRLTSNLSNLLFMLMASIIAGVTAVLSGYLVSLLAIFIHDVDYTLVSTNLFLYSLAGSAATILYIYVFFGLGYLFGTFVQLHKFFAVIIPSVFIGSLFLNNSYVITWISSMYFQESSFMLIFIKLALTMFILFLLSIVISNKLEVKR